MVTEVATLTSDPTSTLNAPDCPSVTSLSPSLPTPPIPTALLSCTHISMQSTSAWKVKSVLNAKFPGNKILRGDLFQFNQRTSAQELVRQQFTSEPTHPSSNHLASPQTTNPDHPPAPGVFKRSTDRV